MKKNKTTHAMASAIMLLFIVLFLILAGRFLYIQGTGEVAGVSLQKWAEDIRTNTYTIGAERGEIKDRNGMTLAYDRATYRIEAIVDESYSNDLEKPAHVTDPEETAEKLAPLLDMDKQVILDRLNEGVKEGKFQVEFGAQGKGLSQETKGKIEEMGLPGIELTKQPQRYYPNGMFATQVIGLAQNSKEGITGVNGIEMKMDEILTGKEGSISYQRDKYNTKLLEPNQFIQEAEDGKDVYLTIDQKIQTLLEDAMSQVVEEYSPERITAVVMDPETGEVLAMGNRPSYNPNTLENVENWYNDAISAPFEPGSTMKVFTLAAALEEGVFNPEEKFESGSYQINERNKAIHDHNGGEGWGEISYLEGIQRSSNVAAAKLVWEKMGPDTFLNYLKEFRFNQKTGIDLPGEQAGKILYDWPIEKITTSFGQGTTVTPIQQMMAATAIANDGEMMRPFVISEVRDAESKQVITKKEPEVAGKPISAETAKKTRDILGTVVTSENGTAHNVYQLQGYSLAGKTGTAQITDPETGGYQRGYDNYNFSFLGMAPKDDPELMMYVSVKKPELETTEKGVETGSMPVSFIFNNVMENSLHYLNIEPDKETAKEVELIDLPDLEGSGITAAKETLEKLNVQPVVLGDGNRVTGIQVTGDGKQVLPNERVFLLAGEPVMPDIRGWSVRDVSRLKNALQLDIEIIGTGYAMKQSIKPGSTVGNNDKLIAEFAPPTETQDTEKREDNEISAEGASESVGD